MFQNIVTAVVCFGTFGRVLGVSYSNVYFQLGTQVVPVDYVSYGAPAAYTRSQTQPAVIPILPVSSLVAPCPPPCINPNQPLVAYKLPSKPVNDVSV